MIPVVRKTVRIREEPDGAVFTNTGNDKYTLVSPFEAFILSLFDGTRTVKNIASLLKGLNRAPTIEEIQNDVLRLVQNKREYIEIIERPLDKTRIQVDPYIFLLKSDIHKRPVRPCAPLAVDLYLTRKCNLKCIYCFANAEYGLNQASGGHSDETDLNKIYSLIDQMADLEITRATITGGEPTFITGLAQIIRRLIDYDIKVFLATNAYSMNDNVAQGLRDSGLREVQVKLDTASPNTQDKLSGVKGSHGKLIAGIESLKKHSFKVSTVAVVTSWNIHEIPQLIRMCANIGVDEVAPRIYTPGIWALNGRGGAYLNPSSDSILWLERKIEDLQKKYKNVMKISFLTSSTYHKKKESDVPSCPALISTCTILENGLVTPCEMLPDFSKELIIGDLMKESLVDIWKSEKAERWVQRKSVKIEEPCFSCNEFDRCRGGCPWKSFVAYGKWICDPYCTKAPKPSKIPFPEILNPY